MILYIENFTSMCACQHITSAMVAAHILQGVQLASCHEAAGWGLLGGGSTALKPLLCFASFGALCAAVFEALPLVL